MKVWKLTNMFGWINDPRNGRVQDLTRRDKKKKFFSTYFEYDICYMYRVIHANRIFVSIVWILTPIVHLIFWCKLTPYTHTSAHAHAHTHTHTFFARFCTRCASEAGQKHSSNFGPRQYTKLTRINIF